MLPKLLDNEETKEKPSKKEGPSTKMKPSTGIWSYPDLADYEP